MRDKPAYNSVPTNDFQRSLSFAAIRSSFDKMLVEMDQNRYPETIDSQPDGPVRQPCLTYRPTRLHMLAELIPWNRFLGFLNFCKCGLCCRKGWG
jgi:hypothetical protein